MVPNNVDLMDYFKDQSRDTAEFYESISGDLFDFRYEENKWSIKEVIGHIIDTEIIFLNRALRISRGDKTSLPGFDQDKFSKNSNYNDLSKGKILELYNSIRKSTILFFRTLNEKQFLSKGLSDKNNISVRAIFSILIGHEKHHLTVIKERYLNSNN